MCCEPLSPGGNSANSKTGGLIVLERPSLVLQKRRLSPPGEQVVVTSFSCPSILHVILIRALHWQIKPQVQRDSDGLIASAVWVDWKRLRVFSFSLWESLASLYSMGTCPAHVAAARIPKRLGISTACTVFTALGDWRTVLFGGDDRDR